MTISWHSECRIQNPQRFNFRVERRGSQASPWDQNSALFKMGLEDFWSFLESHCQRAKASELPDVDGLFIDIGPITYNSAKDKSLTREGYYPPEFYDDVIKEIAKIVSWVKPGRVVYIGKDGPEATAKLGEIKRRRAEKTTTDKTNVSLAIEVIKPTGPHSRDQNLRDRISQLKQRNWHWRNLEFIYDPRESPGEAEVKFLHYLRNDESAARMSWCVFSNDSDFIPLLLALHRRNLWVRSRRDANWNIDIIHADIAAMFDGSNESVDDFVALMSLVGNDFLPAIVGIEAKSADQGARRTGEKPPPLTAKVVSAYQSVFRTGGTSVNHLVVNGDIDTRVLKALLRKLEQDAQKGAQVSQTKKDEANPKREEAMADAYLHGIGWFTHLYLRGLCDWYWSYIFSERPQIGMMLNRIDAIDMSRDSIPKESFDPSGLVDIHIAGHLPQERTDEFHDKLFGNSMDGIYSSDPKMSRDERLKKVTRSLESARVIARELGEERIEIVPGCLWVLDKDQTSFRTVVIPWEPHFPSDVKDP